MSQSKLKANTGSRRKARENLRERITIDRSDWVTKRHELFEPIAERRNEKQNKWAPSWCRRHRTRHNKKPPHKPIVFIVFLILFPFVLYCFTSTVSSTPSKSQ